MLYAYPDYYEKFKCIADKCRHSCCVGWEIDIDEASLRRFEECRGSLGDELRGKISHEDTPHFVLGENERCPFLDERNLCRLITEKGEDFLCDICRDHPRFRSYLPGRTEIGLGLCCEEAARLILTQKEPVTIIERGENEPDEETENIISGRNELFAMAQNRCFDISTRIQMLLDFYDIALPEKSPSEWAEYYLSLERLEDAWTKQLEMLKKYDIFTVPNTTEYEQLLVYFLYRHIPECYEDFDADSKILFAVLSTQILGTLAGENVENLLELARLYSAEIEYSDENTELIYDELMK
ncbi:MAG: flagellin lysine-N-methylase [Bacillota bacterium]|nr:flagellin lysine-N-methylase [Bacillota bacterium]